MTDGRSVDNDAPPVVHEPRCNTYCLPGSHYLTSGIGLPHIHRTDLGGECGECLIPPAVTD